MKKRSVVVKDIREKGRTLVLICGYYDGNMVRRLRFVNDLEANMNGKNRYKLLHLCKGDEIFISYEEVMNDDTNMPIRRQLIDIETDFDTDI